MNSYFIPSEARLPGANFSRWNATYSVPATPAATTNKTYVFYWIGLQDTRDASSPVLQPVLSFTGSGTPNLGEPSPALRATARAGGRDLDNDVQWYFMSWNCCPSGHKYSAPYVNTTAGAAGLRGEVSCAADGTCTVLSVDKAGEASSLTLDNGNVGATAYNWAIVELETYYIRNCPDYCGGTFGATEMSLYNADGTEVSPTQAGDWTNNPYLQLNTSGSEMYQADAFTKCCNGAFSMGWPSQFISQN
eukprot:g2313.t1